MSRFRRTLFIGAIENPLNPVAIYNAKGRSNRESEPIKSILPNLAPNENRDYDIKLMNIKFNDASGYGGKYVTDFTTWNSGEPAHTIKEHSIHITSGIYRKSAIYRQSFTEESIECQVKVTGSKPEQKIVFGGGGIQIELKEGINDIKVTLEARAIFGFETHFDGVCDITIELLGQYEGGLLLDGIDNYGICEKFPVFDINKGYTVIVKRKWITPPKQGASGAVLSKNVNDNKCAFIFERIFNGSPHAYSYGATESVALNDSDISWQTSSLYNNKLIPRGKDTDTSNTLCIGILDSGKSEGYSNFVFYEAYIFDYDLTPDEIAKYIKDKIDANYVLPIE